MAIRSHNSTLNQLVLQLSAVLARSEVLRICAYAAAVQLTGSLNIASHFGNFHFYIKTVSIGLCHLWALCYPGVAPFPPFAASLPPFATFALVDILASQPPIATLLAASKPVLSLACSAKRSGLATAWATHYDQALNACKTIRYNAIDGNRCLRISLVTIIQSLPDLSSTKSQRCPLVFDLRNRYSRGRSTGTNPRGPYGLEAL